MSDQEEKTHEEKVQDGLEIECDAADAEVIHLSEAAKNFLNSDLAGYIKDTAEITAQSFSEQLLDVDPTDFKKINELQIKVKLYRNYERTLGEIVAAGDTAYQLYLEKVQANQE